MPCSKKRHFAFQTFTETPTITPSTLGFGITHQPHEGGDGAKCGAKFAATPHVIYIGGYWSVIKEERDKETSLSAGLFLRNISTETREIRS